MTLQSYEEALLSCDSKSSESVFQKIADSYEDDLLEFDGFPSDYFDFALKLLSDDRFYVKAGVWNFLLVLGTESHKLTEQHYRKLSDCIIANYKNYDDEDLCLAVCDFIARNYSLSRASSVFNLLDEIEDKKPADMKGFVEDGRRIMLAEEKRRTE